tara:strand:- start:352 stop:495 length:144 start_codon:yes stop_codon:yes gene_type:complete
LLKSIRDPGIVAPPEEAPKDANKSKFAENFIDLAQHLGTLLTNGKAV